MKRIIQALLILFSIATAAQFSKTHYIPPLSNSDSQAPQGQYLYISCPSITPINFKILELGGTTITGTVSSDNPYVLNIGSGFNTQLLISKTNVSSVRNDKGYIIEAEDLVYVTVRLTSTPQNYQAGGLVSKGLAALGTQFRIGAFVNTDVANTTDNHYTFASILATENNTLISFNDIKSGVSLINNTSAGNTPSDITLNSGESYVIAVEGPTNANRDGLIGASISSNKPIAVNCGSFAGSNGTTPNLDLGFDQIVSAERTGKEYIFIKGNGPDATERPLIIANEDNTAVFLNGSITPFQTLNAGGYIALNGSQFSSNGNLYVKTSKNVFAFQGIGGTNDQANQNMHFAPPLSCETPKIINNIPLINEVGNNSSFTGTVCIVTETDATLNFIINGNSYTLASLPNNISVNGPLSVTGNTSYVTYTFDGLSGNIAVLSTKQVYLSYFGSSGAATYGGFYSGFTFKPEVTFKPLNTNLSNCIPNIELKVNTLTAFDEFQWYFNNTIIPGATGSNYLPSAPGYYYVSASISACGTNLNSVEIPVSECPTNKDEDLANDNVDLDLDNDGLENCLESYGDLNINLNNTATGNITIGNYANSFTGTITNDGTAITAVPFNGNSDGRFISEVPIGKGNAITYKMDFAQPVSIALKYVNNANSTDLINSDADFTVKSPINKTITVLNKDNQLLIDTNYDGIYESGITAYSSFEIRFRVNRSTPLPAGTGTFSFHSYLTTSFSFTQKNLSDLNPNKATFLMVATCVPKDHDADGIADQLDLDSDNDGILDNTEYIGKKNLSSSNSDSNNNGWIDAYETILNASDTDADGIEDFYDLDSDNDGIFDLTESGSNVIDANWDGIVDGNQGSFGSNGLSNLLETVLDNGVLSYNLTDTDGDGVKNYIESDSDKDGCSDVIEAGFTDSNTDAYLGDIPIVVNANGLVTSRTNGYTIPSANYTLAAPITITSQPVNQSQCELQNVIFTISSNIVNGYQWQVSSDGVNWTNLTNNSTYSGTSLMSLKITSVSPIMNGYQYRVVLNKNGNSCGLTSDFATLNTYPLPVIKDITITQCDDNLDAITTFNLTVKNNSISNNAANETFTYYTSLAGAETASPVTLIATPLTFSNTTPGTMPIWARIENTNGCFRIAKLTLQVLATNIPSTFNIPIPTFCDDFLDANGNDNANNNNSDGISSFDFSSATPIIKALLPIGNYVITYYRNKADALAEINAITTISNYRNIDSPNSQAIWVRVDSDIDNACYGLGPFIKLTVEALPIANSVIIAPQCDDNQDGIFRFNTATLESTLLQNQSNVTVTYFNAANNPLKDANNILITSPFPAIFYSGSQTIKAVVKNNTSLACDAETTIEFIVDQTPVDFMIPSNLTTICDDEINPLSQDGKYNFTTAQAIHDAILLGQPAGIVISYFDENNIALSSPLPNPFPVTNSKLITVRLKNTINPSCSFSKNILFKVNPFPKIALEDKALVCGNLPNFYVQLSAGITDGTPESYYQYIWTKDTNVLSFASSPTLSVNAAGIYTVAVSTPFGCSSSRTITVVTSEIASLNKINIIDLSDPNTITVDVSGNGNYAFSLDYENAFQDSNFFNNVSPGIHEVFIKDLNGCGTVSQTVSVIGAPLYFTPNGDGYNDTWNIKGVSTKFNYNTSVSIFDRFGKLLKQIEAKGEGWDGTINGNLMPATDYWYVVSLEDGRIAKGHFALKR